MPAALTLFIVAMEPADEVAGWMRMTSTLRWMRFCTAVASAAASLLELTTTTVFPSALAACSRPVWMPWKYLSPWGMTSPNTLPPPAAPAFDEDEDED